MDRKNLISNHIHSLRKSSLPLNSIRGLDAIDDSLPSPPIFPIRKKKIGSIHFDMASVGRQESVAYESPLINKRSSKTSIFFQQSTASVKYEPVKQKMAAGQDDMFEDDIGEAIITFSTPKWSWFNLCLILMISIGSQWQRFTLAYVKGYSAVLPSQQNVDFEVSLAYPQLTQYYGLLSGVLFALPLSICSIFMGIATDKFNRKWILGIGCILWSLTNIATGLFENFEIFAGCRVLLGITMATCNPAAYSLIRDMFPPNRRATANSVFSSGIYIGNAIASSSITLIKRYGWRQDFIIPGYFGIGFGIAGLLFIREPQRGQFSQVNLLKEPQDSEKDRSYTSIDNIESEEAGGLPAMSVISEAESVREQTQLAPSSKDDRTNLGSEASSFNNQMFANTIISTDKPEPQEESEAIETEEDDDNLCCFVNANDEADKIQAKKQGIYSQFGAAIVQIIRNPCSRWTLVAGSFRFFGGYCIAFYKPIFFQQVYPEYAELFGVLDAAMASILGFISTVAGGILSDRFHSYSYWTKAFICILTTSLATPAIVFSSYLQSNFYVSIVLLGVNYITAEAWGSPTITMLSDVSPDETIGFSISAYLFLTTMSGMLATYLLGQTQIWVNAANDKAQYGYTLSLFCCISYLGSIPFFWLAGRSYVQQMKEIDNNHN